MGDVVADSMLQAAVTAGAQLALMNPGGVRRGLVFAPDGRVTFAEAFDVVPFGHHLVTVTLTGAQIVAALEQQFQIVVQRILQPSAGFTFSWSSTQPLGRGSRTSRSMARRSTRRRASV